MKTRVLIVNDDLRFGGAEVALFNLLEALDPEAFDIEVCLFNCSDSSLLSSLPDYARVWYPKGAKRKSDGLAYKLLLLRIKAEGKLRLPGWEQRATRLTAKLYRLLYFEAARHIETESFDVAVGFKHGAASQFVTDPFVRARRRVVFFRHGKIIQPALYTPIFARADDVVTVSDGMLNLLKERYPESAAKMSVIANVTPYQKIWAQARALSVARPEDRLVLASSGRFSEEKGFLLAVRAAKRLKDAGLSFLWFLIGDGYQRAALEKEIDALHLSDEITITGYQANPFPYVAACDIFVQPSYVEALGNTILEAQVLLKPVVATRTPGATSLIREGENGALCDFTPESLADAVLSLARDPAARGRMKEALQAVDYRQKNEDALNSYRRVLCAKDTRAERGADNKHQA